LLLLAAVQETALLPQLEAALPMSPSSTVKPPQRSLLLTLLFLNAVGLHRLWDLRSYTGQALNLLTGRPHPYSYRHTERFLHILAQAQTDHSLTVALARWTSSLWCVEESCQEITSLHFYLDGHRKAVYSETLIPRGLIGCSGKILGCRALTLLHDEHGHPLLATTHRGDLHLTKGIPQVLTSYEQATEASPLSNLVVDREGMAADFLAELKQQGRTVITILKTNQYTGLSSFTNVGSFIPLTVDQQGTVLREVAPAEFLLPRPDRQEAPLRLAVALIRDLRRPMPSQPADEELPRSWHADIRHEEVAWWQAGWQATPAPAPPTEAKLIPIVSTAETADALQLAQTYIHRWPGPRECDQRFSFASRFGH
jgi:hypothetical protein